MCVMEVRPGQHDSTIQQACTHNVGTVVGDLELFAQLLEAKGAGPDLRHRVNQLHSDLNCLYEEACDLYGAFLAEEFRLGHVHQHDTIVRGDERTVEAVAAAAAEADRVRARKFETR